MNYKTGIKKESEVIIVVSWYSGLQVLCKQKYDFISSKEYESNKNLYFL